MNIDNYSPEEGDISPTQIYNAYQRGFKYVYVEDETIEGKSLPGDRSDSRKCDNQFFKIRLHISEDDKVLKRWKIFEKNGTRYTYDINNFNPEAAVEEELFAFNKRAHKGVEVVDLR